MTDPTIVQYIRNEQAEPMPVRMLLFNNAIQLYEPGEDNFLAAYPYKGIRLVHHDRESSRFELLPGSREELLVPAGHVSLPELLKLTGYGQSVFKKKMLKLKVPLLLGAFLLFVIAIYFLLVSGISGIALRLVSPKKEAELGKLIYASMLDGAKIDTASTEALKAFADQLRLSENYRLQFTVVDEKEVNAFAIPGGNIVVYKGILQQMKQPEELVALLGHEASHVNERHSLRNMLQEMAGRFMLTMIFGDLGSLGGVIAGNAHTLRNLSYSRGLEEEADEAGMQRMLQNNVDPRGMVMLMDRLREAEKDVKMPGFLSTHPLTAERRAHAQQFVKDHPEKTEAPTALVPYWQHLKQTVAKDLPALPLQKF